LTDPGPYLAYLQSFSNTNCSVDELEAMLARLAALPDLAGLAIGTRPDCLDADKLDALAALDVGELWLDLGLQSADDAVLRRVNRGHGAAEFAAAVRQAAARGIKVCAHLIAGLPGEGPDGFAASVDFVSALPVAGVKLHNLYVCRGTPLAAQLESGEYAPMSMNHYVGLLVRVLPRLRPDIVIHRLASDPAPGELVGPAWAAHKLTVLNALAGALSRAGTWQGKDCGAGDGIPPWFEPTAPLPPSPA